MSEEKKKKLKEYQKKKKKKKNTVKLKSVNLIDSVCCDLPI